MDGKELDSQTARTPRKTARTPRKTAVRSKRKLKKVLAAISVVDRGILRDKLLAHLKHLRTAMYVAFTCEGALKAQNAGEDRQIAEVLRLYCSDKMHGSLVETGQMILFLDGKGEVDREAEAVGDLVYESEEMD
jgi:hypothetical protein